jgi:four helix bundle protein
MLHIESVIHEFVSSLGPTITALERHNRGLADQLDRASCSIVLNVAEGNYSQKANRPARYFNALGSAGESRACLQLARARYGIDVDAKAWDQLDHVIAVLFKLTRKK